MTLIAPAQFASGDIVIYQEGETTVQNLPRPLPATFAIQLFQEVLEPLETAKIVVTTGIGATIASLTGITLTGLTVNGVAVNTATLVGTKLLGNQVGLIFRNTSTTDPAFLRGTLNVTFP